MTYTFIPPQGATMTCRDNITVTSSGEFYYGYGKFAEASRLLKLETNKARYATEKLKRAMHALKVKARRK